MTTRDKIALEILKHALTSKSKSYVDSSNRDAVRSAFVTADEFLKQSKLAERAAKEKNG